MTQIPPTRIWVSSRFIKAAVFFLHLLTLSEELNFVATDWCEPCPANGECYQGKLQCNHGYRKQGTLCIEDGAINESTKKLVLSYMPYLDNPSLVWFLKKVCNWLCCCLQVRHFERKVCEAYALNECYGTGTIWVMLLLRLWLKRHHLSIAMRYVSIYLLGSREWCLERCS